MALVDLVQGVEQPPDGSTDGIGLGNEFFVLADVYHEVVQDLLRDIDADLRHDNITVLLR